jgi:hypothetical protein
MLAPILFGSRETACATKGKAIAQILTPLHSQHSQLTYCSFFSPTTPRGANSGVH